MLPIHHAVLQVTAACHRDPYTRSLILFFIAAEILLISAPLEPLLWRSSLLLHINVIHSLWYRCFHWCTKTIIIEVIIMWTVAIYLCHHCIFVETVSLIAALLCSLCHCYAVETILHCDDVIHSSWHWGCDCTETLGAVKPYCSSSLCDYGFLSPLQCILYLHMTCVYVM